MNSIHFPQDYYRDWTLSCTTVSAITLQCFFISLNLLS